MRYSLVHVDVFVIGEQDHPQSRGIPIVSTLSIVFRSFFEQWWFS